MWMIPKWTNISVKSRQGWPWVVSGPHPAPSEHLLRVGFEESPTAGDNHQDENRRVGRNDDMSDEYPRRGGEKITAENIDRRGENGSARLIARPGKGR